MSGAEAGLALGILGLVISVADHYGVTRDTFKRFKAYRHGVRELIDNLDIQRTIFTTESQLLLASVFGSTAAREMLSDHDHPRWVDPDVGHQLAAFLGSSGNTIQTAVYSIERMLTKLEGNVRKFEAALEPAPPDSSFEYKEWMEGVRQKFRFAFSQKTIRNAVKSVRNLTQDFRTLRVQTVEMAQKEPIPRLSESSRKKLENLRFVQNAASTVYRTLASACSDHTEHHAYFSLQPSQPSSSAGVKFSIAYTIMPRTPSSVHSGPVWFIIESMSRGGGQQEALVETALPILPAARRAASPAADFPPCEGVKTNSRRVHFVSDSPTLVPETLRSDGSLPNFCNLGKFCAHLSDLWLRSSERDERCIGRLDDCRDWNQRVYLTPGPCTNPAGGQNGSPASLSDLLSLANEWTGSGRRGLPLNQRVRLARILASALLYYHATPWLRASWSSRDIRVYGALVGTQTKRIAWPEPFVNVSISTHDVTSQDLKAKYPPFVRNPFLFSLGVMLLELAFGEPLQAMRCPIDLEGGQPEYIADFNTAFRKSKETSQTLGIKYSEITERCLSCDFGEGYDLTNPALQEEVYLEVVCELTRLEEALRSLRIAH